MLSLKFCFAFVGLLAMTDATNISLCLYAIFLFRAFSSKQKNRIVFSCETNVQPLSIDLGNKHICAYCPNKTRNIAQRCIANAQMFRKHHWRDKPSLGLSRHHTPTLNAKLLMRKCFAYVTLARGFYFLENKILLPTIRNSRRISLVSINIGAIDKHERAYQSRQNNTTANNDTQLLYE